MRVVGQAIHLNLVHFKGLKMNNLGMKTVKEKPSTRNFVHPAHHNFNMVFNMARPFVSENVRKEIVVHDSTVSLREYFRFVSRSLERF